MFVCLFVCLFACLLVCLFVCLFVFLSKIPSFVQQGEWKNGKKHGPGTCRFSGWFFGSKTGLMQNQFSHVLDLRYVYNKTKYEYKGTWKAFFSVLSIFAVEKYDAHLTLNSLPIPLAAL